MMPPFDAAQSAMLGFFFGAVITWLVAGEVWSARISRLIDRMTEILEETKP